MTAVLQPEINTPTLSPSQSAPLHDRVAARREALTALDSFVAPMLAERVAFPFALSRPAVDLTIYDEVLRRSNAGGHWTFAHRWQGLMSHTIRSYTVTLHFDRDDRPTHFVASGARDVATEDATPEALARGLDAVSRGGPLVTWAPSFMPGISL